MPQFHSLTRRFNDAPLLIEAPKFDRDAIVRAYHLELLRQVTQFDGYHLAAADPVLFGQFAPFYRAIAQQLTPRFAAAQLTSASRHQFFISMGVETDGGELVIGLSGLERLMGFTSHRGAVASDQQAPLCLTSGNTDMDLLASLDMIFQDRAPWYVTHYSRVDLLDFLCQSQNLRRGKEALDELQAERDRAHFEQNQEAIAAGFRQHGGFDF